MFALQLKTWSFGFAPLKARAKGMCCLIVVGILFFSCCEPAHAQAKNAQTKSNISKSSVPSAAEQASQLERIKNLYRNQYKDKSQNGQVRLARTLFELANEEPELAAKFVLYNEALRIGKAAGDFETAWKSIGHASAKFSFDESKASIELIELASRKIKLPEEAEQMAALAKNRVIRFVQNDSYSGAIQILEALQGLGKRTRNKTLIRELKESADEVELLQEKFNQIAPALERIRQNQGDEQAHYAVGCYYFFDKAEFEKGIELLSKGNPGKLRSLARAEKNANKNAKELVSIADEWWDLAKQQQNPRAREYAVQLYQSVFDELTGLSRKHVESRIGNQTSGLAGLAEILRKTWSIKWENQAPWTNMKFSKSGRVTYSIKNKKIKNRYRIEGESIRIDGLSNPVYYLLRLNGDSNTAEKFDSRTSSLISSGVVASKK